MSQNEVDPVKRESFNAALTTITAANIPFLVGGGIAFHHHTGYPRSYSDLDIFCKAGDYPKILSLLEEKGFDVTVQDEKWLAKAHKGEAQIDVLFSAPNNIQTVEESWFENGEKVELFGVEVTCLGAEELFWSKIYVQNSSKFDGPDVYHLILKKGHAIDWRNILNRMEADWEILLAALINFRFVFPSKRDIIPTWLLTELMDRLSRQLDLPTPEDDICRGPVLSRTNYAYDIIEGGFIV